MKSVPDARPSSETGGTPKDRVEHEPSSLRDERQVMNAFDVFGSDLPDTVFEGVFVRMTDGVVRSQAPKGA
jgi:hypothetical protein